MTERYKSFPMRFERNEPGVLEMIFDGPNLNAVDAKMHTGLPQVFPVIDADPETRAVIVRSEGRAFSAGGSFGLRRTRRGRRARIAPRAPSAEIRLKRRP
ncbi:MAG: enoyl-CoA hydratase-related protein [Betaproteobacteria bacterium]